MKTSIFVLLFSMLSILFVGTSYADEKSGEHVVSVYVSPLNYIAEEYTQTQPSNIEILDEKDASKNQSFEKYKEQHPDASVSEIIQHGLAEGLATLHGVKIVKELEINSYYNSQLDTINAFKEQGDEAYKTADLNKAIKSYREASRLMLQDKTEIVAPKDYATILKNLALSQIESPGALNTASETMYEMSFFNPYIVFQEGLYPTETINAYKRARQQLDQDLLNLPNHRFMTLQANAINSDYILSGVLLKVNEKPTLIVYLWNTKTLTTQQRKQIVLDSFSSFTIYKAAMELSERIVKPILPQQTETTPQNEKTESESSKYGLSINFVLSYFTKMGGPDWLKPYPHLGINANLWLYTSQQLSLFIGGQVVTATSEYSGALTKNYTNFSAFLGFDIGVDLSRVRLGLSMAYDFTKLGEIEFCNSNDFRVINNNCMNEKTSIPVSYLFGVNLTPHIGIRIVDQLELRLSAMFSFYFLPRDNDSINYPISGMAGLFYLF